MPIVFDCPCRKRIRAKDGSVGRVIACPACNQQLEIPATDAVDLGIVTGNGIKPTADDPDFSSAYPVAGPALRRPISRSLVQSEPLRVTVVDLDMPFGSLVWMIIKIQFASLVAALLIFGAIAIPCVIVIVASRIGK